MKGHIMQDHARDFHQMRILTSAHLNEALGYSGETSQLRPDHPALAHLSVGDRALFAQFGSGPQNKPLFPTIIQAFEHYAREQSEVIAIECGEDQISYGALNQAAQELAIDLRRKGVKRGDSVCLYLQRSIGMVVGILAALKIGANYIPQHLGVAKDDMLRHISTITNSRVVVTLDRLRNDVPLIDGQELVVVDRYLDSPTPRDHAAVVTMVPGAPDDTCMILFTSGTTGVPNGVQVTNRNLCNILLTSPGDLGIRPGVRVGQILSIAFDMAAWETLGCLTNGGTLVIRGKSIQETAEKVDVLIATPSILNSLDASKCNRVKTAAVAGEPCPRPLADLWGGFCNFYNSCGPTETTIINTAERHFPTKQTLSIGKPTPNNTVYVLDDNLKPLPIGEKGEMWAGGDCVTAGYLANDKLNAERYRPDQFLGDGRMMFRTRDLGRWTANGELEHFGRVDDQVKVRGFRVELDGVSAALERADGCDQAVTLKLDSRNLVSFISPAQVNVDEARKNVINSLPYYCEPTVILSTEKLPRTTRGKIDKRALLEMAREEISAQGVELH